MTTPKKKDIAHVNADAKANANAQEQVIVTGEPIRLAPDAPLIPFDPTKPLENIEKPLETEFFEDNRDAALQPAGVDENLEPLQSDGKRLQLDPEGGSVKGAAVGDEVLYCRGYKDTGQRDETGNRILEPDYAPATIYQVDDERKKSGHVLLVFAADDHGNKQAAWAHNAEGNPGYWTTVKK